MGELREQLDTSLAPSYRIVRELGGGGMSQVFLAEEIELKRQVVIKVLPPEMAASLSTDRFRREIEVVARLQHPHIVPVLTAGQAGDLLYYVMPFIQGESLRAKLAREGELPIPEASRILREVTDALTFAHSQGVVHRDIKPDNVMLSSGHALVTDFGIAKALDAGQPTDEGKDGATALTTLGVAIGTPTYMSPEQAMGDAKVDHRADIYSLGVMAYEMFAGRPPFSANTPQAMLAAHVTQAPEQLRRYRDVVPEPLADNVMRCLAKRPADRPQWAAELLPVFDAAVTTSGGTAPVAPIAPAGLSPSRIAGVFALGSFAIVALVWAATRALGLPDWVVWAAGALLLIGFPNVVAASRRQHRSPAAGPMGWVTTLRGSLAAGGLAFLGLAMGTGAFVGLRALGVGPFATLLTAGAFQERDRVLVAEFENGTNDSLLAAALTEALTVDLSQSAILRLVPPAEISAALERMQRDPSEPLTAHLATEVAAREGIKAIIVGEIASLAGGYVLSARVLDATGATLFATRTSADGLNDILASLETLSRRLREGIGEPLKSIRNTQPLERVTTNSLEALQLYTRAVRDWDEGQSGAGLGLLRQAVALDSNFAMAWRRLSGDLANAHADPAEIFEASKRAYDLRDRLPPREALHLAAYHIEYEGAFDEMIEIYERILASWPDDRSARNNLGLFYRVVGRYGDAETILQPPVDSGIAPASTYYNLVATQIPQSRFSEAQGAIDLMTERMPETPMRWELASFLEQGRNDFDAALVYAESLSTGGIGYRYWGHMLRSEVHRVRGQLREADAAAGAAAAAQREQGSTGNALKVGLADARARLKLLGDTAGATRQLDAILAGTPLSSLEPLSRPYGDLIRLRSELAQLEEARAIRDEYEAAIPEPFRHGDATGNRGLATLAAAERRHQDALRLARRAGYLSGCDGCTGNLLGDSFEALGQLDSAIAVRERLVRPPTFGSEYHFWRSVELPLAHRRLAQLYEERGSYSNAAEHYAAFIELWRNADPELQPAVAAARARLAALPAGREGSD